MLSGDKVSRHLHTVCSSFFVYVISKYIFNHYGMRVYVAITYTVCFLLVRNRDMFAGGISKCVC